MSRDGAAIEFLSLTNSAVQTFVCLVVDISTRWELDDYFKQTKERATVTSSAVCVSDSKVQTAGHRSLVSAATACAAVHNVKVHLKISKYMGHT